MFLYSVLSVGVFSSIDEPVRYLVKPSAMRCAHVYIYRLVNPIVWQGAQLRGSALKPCTAGAKAQTIG